MWRWIFSKITIWWNFCQHFSLFFFVVFYYLGLFLYFFLFKKLFLNNYFDSHRRVMTIANRNLSNVWSWHQRRVEDYKCDYCRYCRVQWMQWAVSSHDRSILASSSSPWLASCCRVISSITEETSSEQRQHVTYWPQNRTMTAHLSANQRLKPRTVGTQPMDTHHNRHVIIFNS